MWRNSLNDYKNYWRAESTTIFKNVEFCFGQKVKTLEAKCQAKLGGGQGM